MSEHERPATVSDDEQSPAPTRTASADCAAAAEPTDAPASPGGDSVAPPAGDAGDAGAVAADPRSALLRPRNMVIGATVAVLVLAAVVGPIAWDAWGHDKAGIVTPPRVAGLVLDDSQGAHDTIDYLRTAVQTGVSLEKSTGAVYADEAGQSRSVLFVGGTGSVNSPDAALTKSFGLISDDTGGVDGVQSLSPGPLGGVMKCGSTKTDGGSMAVCGWADRRSLGIAMFPNRPVDQSAELLRAMRKVMQKDE